MLVQMTHQVAVVVWARVRRDPPSFCPGPARWRNPSWPSCATRNPEKEKDESRLKTFCLSEKLGSLCNIYVLNQSLLFSPCKGLNQISYSPVYFKPMMKSYLRHEKPTNIKYSVRSTSRCLLSKEVFIPILHMISKWSTRHSIRNERYCVQLFFNVKKWQCKKCNSFYEYKLCYIFNRSALK